MRAQRAFQEIGLGRDDRPKITKSHIVCAEPMPGEKELLDDFVERLEPKLLGHLVRQIFNKMKLAGEAGSLLKIEEEIRDEIKSAKREWAKSRTRAVDRTGQPLLFTEAEMERISDSRGTQLTFDFSGITDETFWHEAEDRVIEALHSYAQSAANGKGYSRKLFVDDTERGFAFIDLCRKRYDVVLMNPPFGDPSRGAKKYIEDCFPTSKDDLACAFVGRWLEKCRDHGKLGAITTRTPFFLSSGEKWRKEVILGKGKLETLADCGFGVLDAMVETMVYVVSTDRSDKPSLFIRVLRDDDKGAAILDALGNEEDHRKFLVNPVSFSQVPGSPICYWVSDRIRRLFKEFPPFEGEGRTAKQGLATADDFRFVRLYWEVSRDSEARSREETLSGKRWVPFAKGGAYSQYYADLHLVVNWDNDGEEIRNFDKAYIRNEGSYFRQGLTWPRRTQKGFNMRTFPANSIFADKGPVIFSDIDDLSTLLALSNSSAFQHLLSLQMVFGSYEVGVIQRTPVPKELPNQLSELARTCFQIKRSFDTIDDTTHVFLTPSFIASANASLSEAFSIWQKKKEAREKELLQCQQKIDDTTFELYGITGNERESLTSTLEKPEEAEDHDEDADEGTASQSDIPSHIHSLLSWSVGIVLGRFDIRLATGERPIPDLGDPFDPLPIYSPGMLMDIPENYPITVDWDGILADDENHSDDIVRRTRDVLQLLWKEKAESIEQEACETLGVKALRDYFIKPGSGGFFDDHIKRYSKSRRKAPIYWLLQSSKKNYAIWLYYHRLDKDMLFKALENYVRPKIQKEENRLQELRAQRTGAGTGGAEAKRLEKEIDRQEAFILELSNFKEKLEKVAKLYLEPDLNDGVILNIAPLWELVPWNEPKKYWEKLLMGNYEWSSIGKQLREKGIVKG